MTPEFVKHVGVATGVDYSSGKLNQTANDATTFHMNWGYGDDYNSNNSNWYLPSFFPATKQELKSRNKKSQPRQMEQSL